MPNLDLSREATDFTKHYHSVRMQQGRVLTDDDFNSAEILSAEDARRVRADVIGPAGSPDDGFRLQVNSAGELVMMPGTFYVGGLKADLEKAEPYASQRDYLQQGANPADVFDVRRKNQNQLDFVWLEVWQQPVTAVEDSELFEVALGGADTSGRIRTMRRAHILSDVDTTDCGVAWRELQGALKGQGRLDDDFELVPRSKLKIEPDGTTGSGDLCSPSIKSGFLGAENQAIRVQIVSYDATAKQGTFTWGFDNAAPLYRARLEKDSKGQPQLHLLTLPKDQAHYPLEGQVVEILPWSAVLGNHEKIAELSGHLATVQQGYDPDTQNFLIDAAPPAGFGEAWTTRADVGFIRNGAPVYFYVRMWNRGGDTTSAPAIQFSAGNPVVLGNTGLKITFSGAELRKEDFWIAAVRPDTPDQFVPWSLGAGRAPNGVRRWIAPLGIIRWSEPGKGPEVVHDCRPTFIPLTRLRGCCTYTVGDGITTRGHFDTIQAAVDALPQNEGGQVCLLPGVHRGGVLIKGRKNVTIQGCGLRSRVVATPRTTDAIFAIVGSSGITIERMAIEAQGAQAGILVYRRTRSSDLRFLNLQIWAQARSGIEVQDGLRVKIDSCAVRMANVLSQFPAIFVIAREAWIERNALLIGGLASHVIVREPTPAEPGETSPEPSASPPEVSVIDHTKAPAPAIPSETQQPRVVAEPFLENAPKALHFPLFREGRGGLQLGCGCHMISVRENLIVGGFGHGITLGSFRREGAHDDDPDSYWIIGIREKCEACDPGRVVVDQTTDGGADEPRFTLPSPLVEIAIRDNKIYEMGMSGIGVAGYFDLTDAAELVEVQDLAIEHNDIRRCLQRELMRLEEKMTDLAGYGAISLAVVENLKLRDNEISENGREARGNPVCGVFILAVEGMDICRNRILDNGPEAIADAAERRQTKSLAASQGRRGGIHIVYALAAGVATSRMLPIPMQDGVPALRVHDNIVAAPVGQALSVVALGPVSIEGNQFTTRGIALSSTETPIVATTVMVLNLGSVTEFSSLRTFLNASQGSAGADASYQMQSARLEQPTAPVSAYHFIDGNTLFIGNQVKLEALESPKSTGAALILGLNTELPARSALLRVSVVVAGIDDIGFADNQCECIVGPWARELLAADVVTAGLTVRFTDNRLKETPYYPRYSALTLGLMNATTSNQSTSCILAYGLPRWRVYTGNCAIRQNSLECERFTVAHMKKTLFFYDQSV